MTDSTPKRTIGGLPPRAATPDLSRLVRSKRPTPKPAPEVAPTAEAKPTRKRRPATSSPASAAETGTKHPVTSYISSDVRERARAAFKATAHIEGDASWSAFIEQAILAETMRREKEYNDGIPYQRDPNPLASGPRLS